VTPDQPLKLAFITETYPPEINGVAVTLVQWVHGLAKLGHDVQLIRPKQNRSDADETDGQGVKHVVFPGIPVILYPDLRIGRPAKGRFLKLWQKDRPDVIHVATEGPLGFSALMAARKLGIPTTTSFHTNFHEYAKHYGFGIMGKPTRMFLRWVHSHSDSVIVATDDIRKSVAGIGIDHVGVLPRGVDIDQFSPSMRSDTLRRTWGADQDTLVVGYVGRLAEEKGIPTTFDAFKAIKAKRPDAKMVVVGDGPVRKKLEHLCPEAHFAGMQTGLALAEHFASIDVFVFASETETFGNVVIEAMASGVPTVAYDYAAANLLGHEADAISLVPLADRDALIQAAVTLALAPEHRSRMSIAGNKMVQTHSWASVMGEYADWLRRHAETAKR